jgi:hypothetical protein
LLTADVLAKQAKEKSYFLGAIDAGQGIVLFEASAKARHVCCQQKHVC